MVKIVAFPRQASSGTVNEELTSTFQSSIVCGLSCIGTPIPRVGGERTPRRLGYRYVMPGG